MSISNVFESHLFCLKNALYNDHMTNVFSFSFLLLCECGWKQDKENYKCMKLVQQIFFILLNRLRHALTKRRLWYTTDFLWTSHRTYQWAAKLNALMLNFKLRSTAALLNLCLQWMKCRTLTHLFHFGCCCVPLLAVWLHVRAPLRSNKSKPIQLQDRSMDHLFILCYNPKDYLTYIWQ